VVLLSQVVGLLLALSIAALRGEPIPSGPDLVVIVVAGLLGGVGITALYRALAIGRMGVVAPVTGVLAAVIPVSAGIVLEGWPAPLVLVGIGLAILAVLLVSRVSDGGGGPSGLREALLAGVAIGCFGIAIAQLSDGIVFSALTLIRSIQALLVISLVIVTGSAWRLGRRAIPGVIAIGVLDMGGNAFYLLAVQSGALAVASVLSSLYPVVTVILAAIVLRERVTRDHAVGIILAAAAIVCIGVGNA
jgi:drug/metabolite transporter (DMT)-like permease